MRRNITPFRGYYRRVLIGSALGVKMVISIYQYSWFIFAFSLNLEQGWSPAQLGLIYTVLLFAVTLVQPFSGMIADAHGPRKISLLSACLVGGGILLGSYVSSPLVFCLCYGLGGLGVGALNGISTAAALKWFPDKRGLSIGLVEFGFGGGTLFFNYFLQSALDMYGWRDTFFYMAFFMWAVLVPLTLIYTYPPADWEQKFGQAGRPIKRNAADFRPIQMVATNQWLIIYLGFILIVSVVLMFASHLKMIAQEFHISGPLFSLVLVAFPIGNGLSRIVAGLVSDVLGRERTMALFFSLLGCCMLALGLFGATPWPWLFLVFVFLAGLLGGAPFVLYAVTLGDYFGSRHFTANWGLTVTGKAWAGLIAGWFSGFLVTQFGTYHAPLLTLAACCFGAALVSNPWSLRPPGGPIRREPRHSSHKDEK